MNIWSFNTNQTSDILFHVREICLAAIFGSVNCTEHNTYAVDVSTQHEKVTMNPKLQKLKRN